MPPNKACTRRLGLCAFSSSLRGLELTPPKWHSLRPPSRRYRLLHLSSAEINLPGSSFTRAKNKICRSSSGSQADPLFSVIDFSFCGNVSLWRPATLRHPRQPFLRAGVAGSLVCRSRYLLHAQTKFSHPHQNFVA